MFMLFITCIARISILIACPLLTCIQYQNPIDNNKVLYHTLHFNWFVNSYNLLKIWRYCFQSFTCHSEWNLKKKNILNHSNVFWTLNAKCASPVCLSLFLPFISRHRLYEFSLSFPSFACHIESNIISSSQSNNASIAWHIGTSVVCKLCRLMAKSHFEKRNFNCFVLFFFVINRFVKQDGGSLIDCSLKSNEINNCEN